MHAHSIPQQSTPQRTCASEVSWRMHAAESADSWRSREQ